MPYILAGDFRKGITFELDSSVQVIVDFQHVKPGKGAAFVRAKIRNVMTGGVIERTFNPSEKYELAHIDRKKMSCNAKISKKAITKHFCPKIKRSEPKK